MRGDVQIALASDLNPMTHEVCLLETITQCDCETACRGLRCAEGVVFKAHSRGIQAAFKRHSSGIQVAFKPHPNALRNQCFINIATLRCPAALRPDVDNNRVINNEPITISTATAALTLLCWYRATCRKNNCIFCYVGDSWTPWPGNCDLSCVRGE